MAALTAGVNHPGATVDLGPGGPPAARTTGPAGWDRSAAVSSGTRTVRSWPLLVLAAPAAAEVWSGWVGIAKMTGFGLICPLPGILPSLHLDTSITLPVGVEAYAAYALHAWLADEHSISGRTRRFAKWSAICSFALGMAGQVAYHLLAQAGTARAPWPVTTIVSCLPVLVLAMGTTLAHMLRADAGSAADTPDNVTGGPAVSRSRAWPAEDQADAARDQAAPPAPLAGTGPSAETMTARQQDHDARAATAIPSGIGEARMAASRLTAAGRAVSRRGPAQRGSQGLEPGPERPGAHDQRRAGGHSSCPGQTRQRHGANLIPRRRPCSWRTRPAAGRRSRGYGRLRQRPRAEVKPPMGREGGVTHDSRRIPPASCPGDPHNCELLLSSQEAYRGRCAQADISGHEAVVSAMAVGLVIDVWRNGPVEDMHCGKRGPDDAAMFAESTSLHDRAVTALTAGNRPIGLLEFEDHLLDRGRPWAGTGGKTLKDLGYGFLGQYRRHVKDQINTLLDLGHHTCIADPLEPLLVTTAILYGRHHKGMPRWPVIVERIGILLADPAHAEWGQDGQGVRALAEMPPETPSPEGLAAALLSAPSSLPVTVLQWLSHHLLYCAAPPYSLGWDEQFRKT